MRVKIYTNIQKSQFRDLGDGNLQILGIPITVDDAVMNGIHYDKSDNAKGLASYRDNPVTLRHPEDVNGNGISALSGSALMEHFSGGIIVNTYNVDGINYADAQFKEKLMLAQDNGEYYVNRFKEGLPIGISTGLYFDGNNQSGFNAKGEEYQAKAINQVGDHVAMLPDEEPPAGGAATFIRFNGKNDDQELTINIDEMLLAINKDVSDIIDSVASNEDEKGLLARFFALCKRKFASDENGCDNDDNKDEDEILTNKEGDAMRETLTAALAAKGITVNAEISDGELLAKYNESNKVEATDLTATNAAIASLVKTVETLQTGITANADKELDEIAKQAAPLLGCDEAEAKLLGVNALHKVLAKNGVTIGVASGTNHQSPEGDKEDKLTKFWEAK
jgi:hypothetical protein